MIARLVLVTGATLCSEHWRRFMRQTLLPGKTRYKKNCVNCHGKTGKGMASFPPLKGRNADYIIGRLEKYRAREKVGPNSVIMMEWAAKLSDDEIANIAAYVSTTFE